MILRKINIISIGCEISQHCKEFVPKKWNCFYTNMIMKNSTDFLFSNQFYSPIIINEKQYIFPFLKSILFPNYDNEKQYIFPFFKSILFPKQWNEIITAKTSSFIYLLNKQKKIIRGYSFIRTRLTRFDHYWPPTVLYVFTVIK
jgi:hypothetical protein